MDASAALADPTRRSILDVLSEARLVRARKRRREWTTAWTQGRWRPVNREWLESFAPYFEESLGRLKRRVEEGEG